MPRNVRTARGEIVDFDALILKQKIAQAPMSVEVARRKEFIDNKEGRGRGRAAASQALINHPAPSQPAQAQETQVVEPQSQPTQAGQLQASQQAQAASKPVEQKPADAKPAVQAPAPKPAAAKDFEPETLPEKK